MQTSQLVFKNITSKSTLVERNGSSKAHFVKYQWNNDFDRIVLNYYDRELMQVFDWAPEMIDISVSGPRKCIGFYQSGRYHPCIVQSMTEDYPQCLNCASQSIPIVRCVFEPECAGERCPTSVCGQPHQVYIAFFNTNFKVGMTSQRRLARRIFEQGADAYTSIATLNDRLEARTLERNISRILRYRESYEPNETLRKFTENIRISTINEKYRLVSKSLKNKFGLKCSDLFFIKNYPLKMPLRSMPKLRSTTGIHRGKFVGIKGKFLIYDDNGLNALRLDELLGNYLRFY